MFTASLARLFRLGLSFIFLLGGLSKIVGVEQFFLMLRDSYRVPPVIGIYLAASLAAVEILLAALLHFSRRPAWVFAAALLTFVYSAILVFHPPKSACLCLGGGDTFLFIAKLNEWPLLRNAGILLGCGFLLAIDRHDRESQSSGK